MCGKMDTAMIATGDDTPDAVNVTYNDLRRSNSTDPGMADLTYHVGPDLANTVGLLDDLDPPVLTYAQIKAIAAGLIPLGPVQHYYKTT